MVGGHLRRGDLPMTVNLRFRYRPGDKEHWREIAASWSTPRQVDAAWVRQGPLRAASLVGGGAFDELEINLQAARWGGASRAAMGGQADYLMLAFAPRFGSGSLVLQGLRNTPDVERLLRDRRLRARFLDWLRSPGTLAAADQGRVELPRAFAAKRMISVSPHGLQRLSNLSYTRLVAPALLSDTDFSKMRRLSSSTTYIRWLDQSTCAGCHQSRSVGGFHLWGEPLAQADGPQPARSMSPLLASELVRRNRVVQALQRDGAWTTELSFPERDESEPGREGRPCGLDGPSFAAWTCASGWRCGTDNTMLGSPVGRCVEERRGTPGATCHIGRIARHANRYEDQMLTQERLTCVDDAICSPPEAGIPGGLCTLRCDPGERSADDKVCVELPLLATPRPCRGGSRAEIAACRATSAAPTLVRRCAGDASCGSDQVCVSTPTAALACVPVYAVKGFAFDVNPWPR
jgi:hypothetical protein